MPLLIRFTVLLTTLMLLGLVTLTLLVSVVRFAPPLAGEYRERIAEQLSEHLGYRVSIGTLRVGMAGWQPRLTLERVTLADPDAVTRALALNAVELDLNLQASLSSRSLQIAGVTLVGAHLELERGEDGRIRVRGLEALGESDPRALKQFLSQGRLDLIESEILFSDATHGGHWLRLVDTRLQVENAGERHWLDLSARPVPPVPLVRETDDDSTDSSTPEVDGQSLQLAMRLQGPPADPRAWSGRGYLRLDGANLGLLLPPGVLDQGWLDTGRTAIEGWLNLQDGRLEQALIRADVQSVRLWSDKDRHEPPPSWRLNALARVRALASGWSVQIAGLEAGVDGAALAGLDLGLRLSPDGRLLALDGRLADLDLSDLSTLLRASPWSGPDPLRTLLERHPRGRLHDLSLWFARSEDASVPPRWQFSVSLSEFGLDRQGRQPGFDGLNLVLGGDQDGGRARLDTNGLALDLNPVFDRPLRLDRLDGRLDWERQTAGGWRLVVYQLALKNADLSGQGRLELQLPGADGRPFVDLRARFQDGNGANVRPYLPAGLMHPQLLNWLETAIVSGRVTQGDLIFRGAPADYPFRKRQGRFDLKLEFEDLRLDYQPDWPAIESAAGHLRFLDEGLTIRVDRGRILDSAFSNGRVDLPDLRGLKRLSIHGEARGPFTDGRRTLAETPLADTLGQLAGILEVGGQSQLVLDIDLPLVKQRRLGVSGVLSWPAPATLGLRGTPIQLSDLGGAVRFNERGIEASSVTARLGRQPIALSLASQDDGLALAGTLDTLDLDDWPARTQSTGFDPTANDLGGVTLASLDVEVGRLRFGELTLNAFKLSGTPDASGWRLRLDARELAGRVHWPKRANGERLQLDLERVDLKPLLARPESAGTPTPVVSTPSAGPGPITGLPSLDLRVERLDWGERRLGTLDLTLRRDALGTRFPRLKLSGPGLLTVEGVGEWIRAADGGASRFNLKASVPDPGQLLSVFDEQTAIEAKTAGARVQLRWPGGPTRFAWARAEGELDIEVGAGRLLKVEPGVGRLLGFVDLGSIGRRLVLDFSDLHAQGFAFERVGGRILIGQGLARFDDFSIEGPAARVILAGVTNLASRQLDQRVLVEPRLGSSVALASAVAGGPVVGAAVYLVDRATGNTLDRLGRYEYRLAGSWNAPEWTRVGWEPFSGFGSATESENQDTQSSRDTNHFMDLP
ncbi:YhdP family protein [Allochromatium palmeri]|uniref:YhdP central domain-containing protein n=1 Tax=Allochromatium palmeri TaxID=231048 RepID=A0A6N8EFL9_9GAMM|nr:DUF3971 domain-containing protein [Allochromatium palmeri]MTW22451.1 hypothetical protein [Allochromatium palmeri]